jgi:hypothetical protein
MLGRVEVREPDQEKPFGPGQSCLRKLYLRYLQLLNFF